MKGKTGKINSLIYTSSGFIFIIFIWWLVSLIYSSSIIPSPYTVLKNIPVFFITPKLFFNFIVTVARSLLAFSIAFVIGSVIGILSGLFDKFQKGFFFPSVILQGSPPILWIIPVTLLLGTGTISVIVVSALIVLPLVIINVTEGVKAIDKGYFDMFKLYANGIKPITKYLIVPSLSPYYRSIIVLGFVLSMKSSVIAEWFGSKNGIGKMINGYFYSLEIVSFYSLSLIFITFVVASGFILQKVTDPFLARGKTPIPTGTDGSLVLNSVPGTLKMSGVSFSYGKKSVVHNVDLDVLPGDVVVIIGDSGAGKTTISRLAAGLLKSHTGTIIKPYKSCILFQDDLLLKHFDLLGNVSLPAIATDDPLGFHKGFEALKKCGLEEFVNYFPDEISGGMKKRAAFARTLVFDPDFVILDEPFNNLDSVSRENLWKLFFELFPERGIPSIIITHYPEELKNMDVRYCRLDGGDLTNCQ